MPNPKPSVCMFTMYISFVESSRRGIILMLGQRSTSIGIWDSSEIAPLWLLGSGAL